MKRFLNIDQKTSIELWLSLQEVVIFDYLISANNWAEAVIKENKTYYRVNTWKILTDLPILWLKTKSAILRYIRLLEGKWFVEKILYNNIPHYCILDKSRVCHFAPEYGELAPQGSANSHHNSNINYSNNIYSKEYISVEKEKNNYQIKEETGLKWVSAKVIIDLWNEYKSTHSLPFTRKWTIMEKEITKVWDKLRRDWLTKEEFNTWLENYLKEIESRDKQKTWSYYTHRFTLLNFLKQSNWLVKFIWYEI